MNIKQLNEELQQILEFDYDTGKPKTSQEMFNEVENLIANVSSFDTESIIKEVTKNYLPIDFFNIYCTSEDVSVGVLNACKDAVIERLRNYLNLKKKI